MKKFLTLVFIGIIIQSGFSQDIVKCREIVKIATEAINTKSTIELVKHLAPDFEIANQKGEIAKMVINQLFVQLDETVKSYKETDNSINQDVLTLKYSIEYNKIGKKDATFIFDKNNKLKMLELFKMEVKTMDNSNMEIKKQENNITKIPFNLEKNLISVKVLLNDKIRTFLLDSGSPKIIINSKYLSNNDDIKNKSIISAKGVSGSISGMNIEKVKQFEFAGMKINNQEMITLDISHLEKELETDIYGLIGYELIKDYDLLFDYKKKELTLINPEYFSQYQNQILSKNKLIIIPFELTSHIPVIKAKIGKKEYSFGLDCGAETNLIDDDLFSSLGKSLKNITKDTLAGAGKTVREVHSGKIKKTNIGSKKFKKMNTVFSDISHLNNGYKINLDGLFGYEILSKQRTIISYKRKELIFVE